MTTAPVGNWWMTYPDGSVWPVAVIRTGLMLDRVEVRKLAPAPDAGAYQIVPRLAIYDSAMNRV